MTKESYSMTSKGSPEANGNAGGADESERFIPVRIEPGLDSLNKDPDVSFKPETEGYTPPDRYRLVFIIMLIHGIGILMPWNMMINAKAYFEDYKLGQNTTEVKELRGDFMFVLGIASQIPNFLMSGINTFFQCGGQASPRRIVVSIVVLVLVFIVTTILAMVDSTDWTVEFFWVTMLTAVILNMATGVYQNSVFGLAAIFPMKYTNAIVLGNNLSGVFIAVVNIICLASAPDPKTQAIYYFVVAIVVLLIAFDAYFILPLTNFLLFYSSFYVVMVTLQKYYKHHQEAVTQSQAESGGNNRSFGQTCSLFLKVFKKIWVQALSVWFVFFVTLSIFPGIWSSVKPVSVDMNHGFWIAIFCFLNFNLFAFLGNLTSEWIKLPGPRWIWVPVVLRGLLIPFFLMCNFSPETRNFSVIIENDYVYIIGGVILAYTSGYYSSLCMMYGPKQVEPEVAGIAGMIMAFCLVTGIVTGVNFSMALAKLVTT